MKRLFLIIYIILVYMVNLNAQHAIKLWEGSPPTSNGIDRPEEIEAGKYSYVSEPEIFVYLPQKDIYTGKAVIICPGGAYFNLAFQHEGQLLAEWLQRQGIAGIVLKYRLPNQHPAVPLEDLQQAMRYVRSRSSVWNIEKVGVAGFSAGGHLAATASTHFGTGEERPDFSVFFYPVITMDNFTHEPSRRNLLGENPSKEDIYIYSIEKQVNSSTPPAVFFLSDDDTLAVPYNSIMYYEALKKNNIPASIYIFPSGGHGWGMSGNFEYHQQMLALLKMWLENI